MENYLEVKKLEKHIIECCPIDFFSDYGLKIVHDFCCDVVEDIDNYNALNWDEDEYNVDKFIQDEQRLGLCIYDKNITYENEGDLVQAAMNYGDDCIDVVMNEWSFTDDFYREETLENLAKMIIWNVED